MDYAELENAVKTILTQIGEDPSREGLLKTPTRVAKAYEAMTIGYKQDPARVLGDALFTDYGCSQMVLSRDIEFYSLCEHHLLPFFGVASVAYIPDGKVVGLSKLPRMIDVFARRLQIQERMTEQIADAMMETIKPKGAAVLISARHLCMEMRGVQKQGAVTTTSALRGIFLKDIRAREEFTSLAGMSLKDRF
ncbi:MAG: GTP cyclohydrolase I FolE [Helicobacteraceae bacterium]|jgi:GTP cyclohydrolase I|nr:GTP cyclohydrolase I FolE [Helicobacteraceae bacterium]